MRIRPINAPPPDRFKQTSLLSPFPAFFTLDLGPDSCYLEPKLGTDEMSSHTLLAYITAKKQTDISGTRSNNQ
jgi:hypothetical protein